MIRDHDRGKKKTYGFASVWRNMTVADMAKSTNRSLGKRSHARYQATEFACLLKEHNLIYRSNTRSNAVCGWC